ncbi:MAG TPA: glutaredoxin 3 [Devosia sp.]|nr:glutaredoxin 3 [Devosia sp.]
MPKVEIFTTPFCGFCVAAKSLLEAKNISYTEIDVSEPEPRAMMTQRAGGRRTVPQIFFGGTHIGGYDDLAALERDGKLDALLSV